MSSIHTRNSPTTAPASAPRRESRPAASSSAPSGPRDSASVSGEATSPASAGSVPSFAARAGASGKKTPAKSETPEQKKAREQREMKKVDELERKIKRNWKGGIMKPTPGSPEARPTKLKAGSLPHRMPKTETPEQRQARLDRECAALRKLHEKHQRGSRSIMTSR